MRPGKEDIRRQLRRIARSDTFSQAGRMYPLLEYLVEAEVLGTAAGLCQRQIAIDVLGRDKQFDPGTDAIVRVEIGRLRHKLREYSATDGGADNIVIDVPRRQYRAQIRLRSGEPYVYPNALPAQRIEHCHTPDGVRLAFSVLGTGYPLVCLATWISHLEADLRNPFMQHYWIELGRRFRLIRYDTRGFGMADREVADFGFDELVTDLEAVVDSLGLERFALLGPSGGASVAAAYAARHPERVSHLVLLSGFIRGRRRRNDPVQTEFADMMQTLIKLGWGEPDSRFRRVFTHMLVPDGSPEVHRRLDDAQLAASSGANAQRYFRVLSDVDVTEEASRITAPTLVLHGADEIPVPRDEALHTVRSIPGARLVSLPTRNHVLMAEEAAWTRFLGELDAFIAQDGGNA